MQSWLVLPSSNIVLDDDPAIPVSYRLEQNYQNPFNPVTQITYNIAKPGRVLITIYNLQGQVVTTLVDEIQSAGLKTVTWNGRNDRGLSVPTGIFFYSIISGTFSETKKMILIK